MISYSEEQTIELGYRLGGFLKKGMYLTLVGDLAGGKTTFMKGVGKALNVKGIINSPTFVILKIYEGDIDLYHIDAYRLENNEYDLGLDEFQNEGVVAVEWPQHYSRYLPWDYLEIQFTYIDDDTREISFIPHGQIYIDLLEDFSC